MKVLYQGRHIFEQLRTELRQLYDTEEAEAIARWLMEDFFGLKPIDFITGKPPDLQGWSKWQAALPLLSRHVPVQYVLGYTWFAGHRFAVGEGVFIPRPETEELLALANNFLQQNAHQAPVIADLCTGTGCIAHVLALTHPQAKVYAFDKSPQALFYARLNAEQLKASTIVQQADVLANEFELPLCDLIISNPPYVKESERAQIHPRVKDFEPVQAIFVPDDNPLLFYHAIAKLSTAFLKKNGWIGVEINPTMAEAVAEIFSKAGLAQVAIHRDFRNNNRFVTALRT
ncbi:MAG: peptide chain release factor N(5)-glutamine methyltransferase [Cytophagales bacterium]|nr:peptide chain release factor N(5)-glutamine methyltransferase [Bernardetiaceae bacterium]MDW8211709.1 peptide chain release factor N(5)-glutamine methyltransferase [Cytophagales bacterium]